ncbi:MAG: FkbM family methyltransferase [Alphaproteobacteria bacterium]|nr:FkbM family methyltransferase [Alphaproteobacteria bacterium]
MSAIALLRRWRHGPLRAFGPVWVALGNCYRMFCRLGLGKAVRQKIGPYGPFLLQPEFAFSNFENWGGAHNGGFNHCIETCRNRTCVLDIGAHIGLVTLPASKVIGAGGRIYAFEPSTANLRYLRRHIENNDIRNAEVIACLVGAEDKESVSFFEQRWVSGMNGLAVKREHDKFIETSRPQISIDRFCIERGLSPDLVKIDVEGAEYGVLQGAAATLRRCQPPIFLSVHPTQLRMLGSDVEALQQLIHDLGYRCHEIDGSVARQLRMNEYLLLPNL